ncbi:helix-turn-helix domain-containing protein [Spongisporangium articulatum]|uniref:Helix-turn-helix domain-containing protein n=1 Tax=Spongisporangium articulatum TaxID=3362603 RepID=A0ABW8ANX7_9ACTN
MLGRRLRDLRTRGIHGTVLQAPVAEALGISSALLSSWERDRAVPPEERLEDLATFYGVERSVASSGPQLIPVDELTEAERGQRDELLRELRGLRQSEPAVVEAGTETPGLDGGFWHFPDGQPITILCTPFSEEQFGVKGVAEEDMGRLPPVIQYANNSTHPNAVRTLLNADVDALLQLVRHLAAANPRSEIRWLTFERVLNVDQLVGHVVILGGGDLAPWQMSRDVSAFRTALRVPVHPEFPPNSNEETDGQFVVSLNAAGDPDFDGPDRETHRPLFLAESGTGAATAAAGVQLRGAPVLLHDVALIVRKPHPFNAEATVTMLSGIFSRGTYGAVRAFTHEPYRSRNEEWLASLPASDDFWVLFTVPVFGGEKTMTPELSLSDTILRLSS